MNCFNFPALLMLGALWLGQGNVVHANEAADIDDVQARIASTSEQLQKLNDEIDRAKSLRGDLQAALNKAESGRGERDARLSELREHITQYDQQMLTVSTRIGRVETSVNATRLALTENLQAAQMTGRQSMLKVILQHENPAVAQRMQIYSGYVFAAQRTLMQSQAELLQQLNEAQDTLRKDRNWLNHIRRKASQQREVYVHSAQKNRSELEQIDRSLAQKTQSIAQLSSDQERLQSLMEELQSAAGTETGYFANQKGKFTPPVAEGTISAHFGDLKSVGKLRWNGLFIENPPGMAVSSVADGEVLYSDWLQGFGMLVILEHGDGYMSLYGGNRTVLVQPGDWVESGSTIATVGDSGGQKTSGLYFEIRHNATALDPENWVRWDQS